MPDYYPLIAQAVSRLPKNTPQARQELFEHARAILIDQLRKRQPPTSYTEIMRERAVLDEAIRRVESEIAKEATLHAGSIDVPAPKSAKGKSESRAFQQGPIVDGPPRGQITISEGQRPVIELGQTADASTFINLTAHTWLEDLMRDALHPQAPDSLRQDARAVLKWLGVAKPETIETRHHDQFARAFERYIIEGRAPSSSLAPAFAGLSASLTKIYGTHSLNAPLNDDIRGVFDRLLEAPDQIATCTADHERAAIISEQSPRPRPVHSLDTRTDDKKCRESKAVERGAAAAQYDLGRKYIDGRGVEKSDIEAVACFRKAAQQGFAPAQNDLGAMYVDGNGIEKNEHEAVVWFRRAAERGYAGAQYNLGVRYCSG
ncbi:MAG TPA: hypothetical protein VGP21_08295 [Opitutaceae bacterium]|nr:hypothetical protein [Opitutaceae bacterium]